MLTWRRKTVLPKKINTLENSKLVRLHWQRATVKGLQLAYRVVYDTKWYAVSFGSEIPLHQKNIRWIHSSYDGMTQSMAEAATVWSNIPTETSFIRFKTQWMPNGDYESILRLKVPLLITNRAINKPSDRTVLSTICHKLKKININLKCLLNWFFSIQLFESNDEILFSSYLNNKKETATNNRKMKGVRRILTRSGVKWQTVIVMLATPWTIQTMHKQRLSQV